MHYEGYLGQGRPLLLCLFNASTMKILLHVPKIKNCKRKDKDTFSYAFISRISDSFIYAHLQYAYYICCTTWHFY